MTIDACPFRPAGGVSAPDAVLSALLLLASAKPRAPPPQPPRAALRPPASPPPQQTALVPFAQYSLVSGTPTAGATARAVLVGGTLMALVPTSQQLCLARVAVRARFSRRVRPSAGEPWRVAPPSDFRARCLRVSVASASNASASAWAAPVPPSSAAADARSFEQTLRLSITTAPAGTSPGGRDTTDGVVSAAFAGGAPAPSLCGAECWLEGSPAFSGAFFAWEHAQGWEMDLDGLSLEQQVECE